MDRLHAHSLGDLLREHRRSRPNAEAAVCDDVRLTFLELDQRVDRLADVFSERGVGPGDRVLWLGQNCHRVLECLLAAAKLGAVFCPANWRQSVPEIEFVIRDVDPTVVLTQTREIGKTVDEARERSGAPGTWIGHDDTGPGGYERLIADASDADPDRFVDPTQAALMMYTAAFGGQPNGALLTHEGLILQGVLHALVRGYDFRTVYLNCGPLFHIATLSSTLTTFVVGGRNVFTPRVEAEELCRLIDAERCTNAFIFGPTIDQMVAVNKERHYDLSSLRSLPSANAEWKTMVAEDDSPMGRALGGYGQTEAIGLVTYNAFGDGCTGTHGVSGPLVQLRVVGDDGVELPAGEVGEIVLRGPTVMVGYHNRPELNAERRVDGWHYTRDLGRREADGSLSFIGPKARMIKSGVENIYPAEVEICLKDHPAVADCGVIGVPDSKWVQSVKAVVVIDPARETSEAELIEHCRANIASYKKPRSVEFVSELPRRGPMVDYEALDEQFGGGGYPGGSTRSY